MPFSIVRQDITRMRVDAIVNAANTQLQAGGGVCGAIFAAAGTQKLQAACDRLAPIATGQAVLTRGYALPAKYIIHAAGPVYDRRNPEGCRRQLFSAYTASLRLATQHGCRSIAFPLISAGVYGYPKAEALLVARQAITAYLQEQELEVFLAVFDKESFQLSDTLLGGVRRYIDQHYVDTHAPARSALLQVERDALAAADVFASAEDAAPADAENAPFAAADDEAAPPSAAPMLGAAPPAAPMLGAAPPAASMPAPPAASRPATPLCGNTVPPAAASMPAAPAAPAAAAPPGLDALVRQLDEPFSAALLRLIDSRGKSDVEVYKKANIDRKLFSKIRTGRGYTPKKPTILALAVALELSLAETAALLARAGYALSHASKFDVIVEYFIVNGQYDIFAINEVLFAYDQPLLGS